EEQVIRSLLHEHTHTRQNRKKFKELYKKYNYATHPFEKAAVRAEGKNMVRSLEKRVNKDKSLFF
ncbi:MAG TPA: hypothetical protein QGF51_08715, partial [Candidatus Marinimicrobia bacterium]|nr:hypothetical protein [Candidatus Neomarinimicrobiota bacterium]